jgi:hypothetical protein
LVRSSIPGLKSDIGVPDFILKTDDNLVLGEIKTDALVNSHKYSFEQYSKFMLFSALCLCSERSDIPKNIVHIIVAPDSDTRTFSNDYGSWLPSIDTNRLHVNAEELQISDRKKRFKDFFTWKTYLLGFLNDERLIEENALSKVKIREFSNITSPEIAPTYLFSWQEFCDVYIRNAEENYASNLSIAAAKVRSLAVPASTIGRSKSSQTERITIEPQGVLE